MKKFTVLFLMLFTIVGCSSNEYVTKDTIQDDLDGLVKHNVKEGDYTFYSSLEFDMVEDMYRSNMTGEKYTIFTKQLSDEQINDDNYEEIFMNATRWHLSKDEETIKEIYDISKEKIELRNVSVFKVTFSPNDSKTRMAVLGSVAYLIPYENGTVEVSISGLTLESEELYNILNTIY